MFKRPLALLLCFLMLTLPLAGCVADDSDASTSSADPVDPVDPVDPGEASSDPQVGTCFALLQTSMESMDAPGDLTVASNYTYNADCRVVSVETQGGWAFTNTTYDADGHPVIITTTTSVDGGATWTTIDTGQSWTNGLMTVSETMGIVTNFTYDADGRLVVQETLHSTYLNTTYDADGNPVVMSTSMSLDGGATWLTIDTNQTWVNGLMTVSEIMGIETNYTYDADGRVTMQETLGSTYVNTTYDAVHGEISVIETALTVDGGATWVVTRTHHTWGNP
ncbi:MAG: hypothetical protein VYB36_05345 [Candidatus Thermoplasmatota archaeon]|nr:hypothetical protein [Candidatus Thermoplasmatota archaeon]